MTSIATKPTLIYLKDYQKPDYLIKKTELFFDIHDGKTRVKSRLTIKQNYQGTFRPIILSGENMTLIDVHVNQEKHNDYTVTEDRLTIAINEPVESVEIETEIEPEKNLALEGLYQSDQILCTQNEPEGFRRITYYVDRPDVLSTFTTTI